MNEENDTGLIAYCGLYCGDCFGYKNKVADLARDLRKELRDSRFKRFADFSATTGFGKAYKDYDACYEVLGAMNGRPRNLHKSQSAFTTSPHPVDSLNM